MNIEKAALLTAFVGICLLLFLSSRLEPKLVKISDISAKMLDSPVKVQGRVIELKEKESSLLLVLNDSSGSIDVFSYTKDELNLSELKGVNVEIIGKVSEYKGKLEITAEKIKLL